MAQFPLVWTTSTTEYKHQSKTHKNLEMTKSISWSVIYHIQIPKYMGQHNWTTVTWPLMFRGQKNQDIKGNLMSADTLAPCITRQSVGMISTLYINMTLSSLMVNLNTSHLFILEQLHWVQKDFYL